MDPAPARSTTRVAPATRRRRRRSTRTGRTSTAMASTVSSTSIASRTAWKSMTGGWPQLAALKPFDEKGSSALALATVGSHVYLYVVHGGYPGDNGDYQGHVTTIDLATGAQTVFNAACSDIHAHLGPKPASPSPPPPLPYCTLPRNAIWSRPGVVYDESLGRLFVSTGNGTYSGNTDGHNWSESILAINPDGTSSAQGPNRLVYAAELPVARQWRRRYRQHDHRRHSPAAGFQRRASWRAGGQGRQVAAGESRQSREPRGLSRARSPGWRSRLAGQHSARRWTVQPAGRLAQSGR